MITREQLAEANKDIKTSNIKGKDYAEVNERVKKFREICPSGSIFTDMLYLEDGVVVIQARISDEEGNLLASGIAYEREGSTNVNRTSYIENCETSAVGRALGFLGIGINGGIASAEEVQTAILQQGMQEEASERELDNFKEACASAGVNYAELWKQTGNARDKSKAHLGLAQKKLVEYTNAKA